MRCGVKVEIREVPVSDILVKNIFAGFGRYSMQILGYEDIKEPTAFTAFNDENHQVGVIVVENFWGAIHIKHLIVEEGFRKQGIGVQLMERVFELAKQRNCPFAFVETMNFQARGFYEKLGFRHEFTRSGFHYGTALHYLRKDFHSSEPECVTNDRERAE